MSKHNQSEVKTWSVYISNIAGPIVTGPHIITGQSLVLKSDYDKLKEENQRLKDELSFTKQYLNPADTSFRQMADSFRDLPRDSQNKLISLCKVLVGMNENSRS